MVDDKRHLYVDRLNACRADINISTTQRQVTNLETVCRQIYGKGSRTAHEDGERLAVLTE